MSNTVFYDTRRADEKRTSRATFLFLFFSSVTSRVTTSIPQHGLTLVGRNFTASDSDGYSVSALIYRDEIEYLKNVPCPITYVEDTEPRQELVDRLSEGYKICKKGNFNSKYKYNNE